MTKRHRRIRKGVVAIAAVAAVLSGAVFDSAMATATALPTGTIEVSVTDYQGFRNDIDPSTTTKPGFGLVDVRDNISGHHDALDGGFHLTLNGRPFKDSNDNVDISLHPDVGDGKILTAKGKTAGLKVTAKVGMFGDEVNYDRARVLYQIKNPGTTKRKVTALYTNNFGSDSLTVVERTSSGDAALNNDAWVISSDDGPTDDDVVNDLVNTTVIGDRSKTVVSQPAELGIVSDTIQVSFTFRIKPGKTAQLLFVHEFEADVAEAENDAEPELDTFAQLTAEELTTGLSGKFVNWITP